MQTLIENVNSPMVVMGLFIASVVLILIDYYFPTDWPCQLGYFCFAFGMFLTLPYTPMASLLIAGAIWAGLVILHGVWFRHYLDNVPELEDETVPIESD